MTLPAPTLGGWLGPPKKMTEYGEKPNARRDLRSLLAPAKDEDQER